MRHVIPISRLPDWLSPTPDFRVGDLGARQVHLFTRNHRTFLVSLPTNLFFEVSEEARAALEAGDYTGEAGAEILHLGRLGVFAEPARKALTMARAVSSITLNVCQACNLACSYCFAQQGSYGQPQALMTPDVADQALDFLAAQPVSRRNIVLFGGEPLLNFPLVEYVLRRATERFGKDGISFDLFLNGTVLTEAMVQTLREYDTRLLLSIDGPPDYQDHHRKFRNGSGTYAAVKAKLPMLAPWFPDRIVARATVTKETPRIDRVAEELISLGFRNITIEPVVDDPTSPFAFGDGDLPLLKESVDRLVAMMRQQIGSKVRVSVLHDPLTRIVNPTPPKSTRCNAGTGYAAIATDGRFYPCHYFVGHETWRLGDLASGLSRERAEELVAFGGHLISNCRECWVSGLCGGPCSFKAAATATPEHLDAVECAYRRYTYEAAIDFISSLYPQGAYPQAATWPRPPRTEEIGHALSTN